MKKVICINASVLTFGGRDHTGDGLVKGREYTALGEVIARNGNACYVISELGGEKLKLRFVDVDKYKKSEEAEETVEESFGDKIIKELEEKVN